MQEGKAGVSPNNERQESTYQANTEIHRTQKSKRIEAAMTVKVDVYYDFRSSYAYFANYRVREGLPGLATKIEWVWHPISIEVMLNLQADSEPWATYVDTLQPAKRAYSGVDAPRMAEFYGAPYKSWWPSRPNSIPALCAAHLLGEKEAEFRNVVFNGLYWEQRDIADPTFLADALVRAGGDRKILDEAFDPSARDKLAKRTAEAYANGVFGVPSFVYDREIFFGADRLEVLAWRVNRASVPR